LAIDGSQKKRGGMVIPKRVCKYQCFHTTNIMARAAMIEPKPAPTRGAVATAAPVCVDVDAVPLLDAVELPVPLWVVEDTILVFVLVTLEGEPVCDVEPLVDAGAPVVELGPAARPETLMAVHAALVSGFDWSYGR